MKSDWIRGKFKVEERCLQTRAHVAVMNYDDVYELCRDKDQLRNWLLKEKLIGALGGLCQFCAKGRITLRKDSSFSKDGVCWLCSDKNCGKKSSIRQDSWFSQSHLTLDKIVKLTYYWVYKYPKN